MPAPPGTQRPPQFGNFDANVRFLEETGLLRASVDVLEIGTGTGAMLRHLMDCGHRVQGVELRPELISQAQGHYGALPVQRVSGVVLPFPDRSFDAVLSFDVFEHIPDSDAHLREVGRVLRDGGAYLIQTPNKWTNAVFETIRWRSLTRWKQDHCALHSLSGLTRRLERHGFTVRAFDVPVVNEFFRAKIRRHLGIAGVLSLRLLNPDRWPLRFRTNLYVCAVKGRTP